MISKISHLIALTTLVLLSGPIPTAFSLPTDALSDECVDDTSFRYKKDETKDCNWVGRVAKQRCKRKWEGKKIHEYCPQVCNKCPGSDDNNNNISCTDDPKFKFNNEKKKNCNWVGLKPKKRCSREWKGLELSAYCPEMCDSCPETTPPAKCEDDETLQYREKPKRNCKWVSKNTKKRCGKTWKGKELKDLCPVTCDACPKDDDTGGEDGCCSLDYKKCIGWCGPTKDSCLSCNHHDGVGWLENGPPTGQCKKRWRGCEKTPDACCPGLTCREDDNNYLMCLPPTSGSEPTAAPKTSSPTGPPSASPTKSPTSTNTAGPTISPTISPTHDDGGPTSPEGACCTLDFKTCIDWCGEGYDSCVNCNHHDGVFWLDEGPPQNEECLSRWTGCENNPDACCDGMTCREDDNNYLMCLPPFVTASPSDKTPTGSPTSSFYPSTSPTSGPSVASDKTPTASPTASSYPSASPTSGPSVVRLGTYLGDF